MAQQTPLAVISFAEASNNFEWYTVVTRFNYEAKFANELLEKLNKNRELLDYFDDLFIPERKCTVEYKNVKGHTSKRIITDKTMSLYVFVKVKMTERVYWQLREIAGCASILSTGSTLITLTDEEIKKRRDDAYIHETTMKNMLIVSKVNPYHNPILALKDINNISNPPKLIIINKNDVNSDYTTLVQTKDATIKLKEEVTNQNNQELYMKRTKVESLPSINDINPRLFLKRLQKLTLTKKFFELTSDDISFMSDEDLQRFKELIKEVQQEASTPKILDNYSSTISTRQHTSSKNKRYSKSLNKPKYVKASGKKRSNDYQPSKQNHIEDKSEKNQIMSIKTNPVNNQSNNEQVKESIVVKQSPMIETPIEISNTNQQVSSEQLKRLLKNTFRQVDRYQTCDKKK